MMTSSTPPPEAQLRRVEAAAKLAHWQCPHCHATLTVEQWRDGLPLAIGVEHEAGCPDFVDDD